MGLMLDTEPAKGTSRGICEKFDTDEAYAHAKRLVRDTLRAQLPAALIEDALVQYGQARAHGVTAGEDLPLAFLGAMVRDGVWNGTALFDRLADVFPVDEVTDDGLLRARWAFAPGELERRARAYGESLDEFVTLLAIGSAAGLDIDPTSNVFLNNGTEFLWRRATGVGSLDQLFDNTHARIGVGSSSTAAARTDTDLLGASKTYDVMEAGFPTITAGDASGGAKSTYKTVFGSTEANHDHKEWVVDNKASGTPGTKVLNRKVQDFGTKASGSTWTYTFELRID